MDRKEYQKQWIAKKRESTGVDKLPENVDKVTPKVSTGVDGWHEACGRRYILQRNFRGSPRRFGGHAAYLRLIG